MKCRDRAHSSPPSRCVGWWKEAPPWRSTKTTQAQQANQQHKPRTKRSAMEAIQSEARTMGRPAYDTSKARVREEHGKPVGNEDGRRRTSATSSVWGEAHQEAPLKPDLRRRRWSRAATPAAVPLRRRSVASSRLQAPREVHPPPADQRGGPL